MTSATAEMNDDVSSSSSSSRICGRVSWKCMTDQAGRQAGTQPCFSELHRAALQQHSSNLLVADSKGLPHTHTFESRLLLTALVLPRLTPHDGLIHCSSKAAAAAAAGHGDVTT
jgi:hypothetical protein